MALRFRGLVKAARHHRQRMLAGIPEMERESFLNSVRRVREGPGRLLQAASKHKKHGFVRAGSRRMSHTPEFLEELRRFPEKESAEQWLHHLSRGEVSGDIEINAREDAF